MSAKSAPSDTGFPRIDEIMDKARTKYANNPELRPRLPFKPTLAPTPEELERNERTDARIAESAHRIAKGKAQLSAPITLQSKVKAAEEHDEMRANRKWDQGYRAADELTDKMLANNQVLFESIMGSIDDVDANCVPLPDVTDLPELPPSPKLEWLSGVPNDVRDWVKQSNEQWEEYPRGEVKLCTIDATRTSTRTEFGEYRTGSEVSAGTRPSELPASKGAQHGGSRDGSAKNAGKARQTGDGWRRIIEWDFKVAW